MKPGMKSYIAREGGKLASDLIRVAMARPRKPSAPTEDEKEVERGADEFTPITTDISAFSASGADMYSEQIPTVAKMLISTITSLK